MNDQKVAIVTGGGSGIGKACAQLLAENGWQVMINGRTVEKLRAVARYHDNINYVVGDISESGMADRLVNHTWGRLGRVDILIHAAGVFMDNLPVLEITNTDWDEMIKNNITSTFFVCQAVAQIMLKHQRSGMIVIVSSLAGLWQKMLPGRMAYNAVNAAKVAIAVTYHLDMKPLTDCQALAACFGLVDTPMTKNFLQANPAFEDQALSPAEAADFIYELVKQPPACPVVTITKQQGIHQATYLEWQPAPSIE